MAGGVARSNRCPPPLIVLATARHVWCAGSAAQPDGLPMTKIGKSSHHTRDPRLAHFELADAETIPVDAIVRGDDDHLGRLVLALALAFNDLKGLALAQQYLSDALAMTSPRQSLEAQGQLHGLVLQTHRWMLGVVHEVLTTLRKAREVVVDTEVAETLLAVDEASRDAWNSLVNIALSPETQPGDDVSRLLAKCRNVVAFHYEHHGKTLARGLSRAFGGASPLAVGPPAFSDGVDLDGTRFYFADAAAHGATESLGNRPAVDVIAEASRLARQINLALKPLIVAHLRRRCPSTKPYRATVATRLAESE